MRRQHKETTGRVDKKDEKMTHNNGDQKYTHS